MTAEPGSTVALYDKDGNKIGEATADNTGKATITPTVDIPAGPVTVKATKDGQTSEDVYKRQVLKQLKKLILKVLKLQRLRHQFKIQQP